jgi:hypothetical protein
MRPKPFLVLALQCLQTLQLADHMRSSENDRDTVEELHKGNLTMLIFPQISSDATTTQNRLTSCRRTAASIFQD